MSFLREVLPSQVIELLGKYLDKIRETAVDFGDAIRLLGEVRVGEARKKLSDSMRREEEADRIKKKIFDLLEEARMDPAVKEQLFYMVTRIDDIADWFKEAARELIIIPYLETPQAIRDGLEKMVKLAVEAAEKTIEAYKKVLEGEGDVKDLVALVDELEEEADMVNLENRGKLLDLGYEIKPYTLAILLHDYNQDLEEATDACQNASDFLRALMVAWMRR